MPSQVTMNVILEQMNMALQSFATHFAHQDKAMADIKTSVDKMNTRMENSLKRQEAEICLDVTDLGLEDMELQNISTAKNVTKHDFDTSAKMLKIQNPFLYKNENFHRLLFQHLDPSGNTSPQESALKFDYIYKPNTVFIMKRKLSSEIHVNPTRRFKGVIILEKAQDEEVEINSPRQQKKEYSLLTKLQIQNKIQYKWLFSGGPSSSWDGKSQWPDPLVKARKFAIRLKTR